MPPLQTIEQFYAAFARLDDAAMAACYAEDATFDDEVFRLRGRREVVGMWTMLCANVRAHGQGDWKLEAGNFQAEGRSGSAHWEAWYRFTDFLIAFGG
jgi:ketosteroid isomerase-like protein